MSKDRKFPENMENPIDNLIISVGRTIYPLFQKLNLTPNLLTLISLILGLLSAYFLYIGNYYLAALLYFTSYIYDVLDGNYARTYDMVTEFGDYFDHIKDLVVNMILMAIFIRQNNYKPSLQVIILIVTITLFITLSMHLNCQERWVEKNNPAQVSGYLSCATKMLNIGNCMDHIHKLKYLGCGTFALWVSVVILLNPISSE